jgi:hypothetical protein
MKRQLTQDDWHSPFGGVLTSMTERYGCDLNEFTTLSTFDTKFVSFLEDLKEVCRMIGLWYDPNPTNFAWDNFGNICLFDVEDFYTETIVNKSGSSLWKEISEMVDSNLIPTNEIKDPFDDPNYEYIAKGEGSGGAVYRDKRDNSILKITSSPFEVIGTFIVLDFQRRAGKDPMELGASVFVDFYSIEFLGERSLKGTFYYQSRPDRDVNTSPYKYFGIRRAPITPFNETDQKSALCIFALIRNYYGRLDFGYAPEIFGSMDMYRPIRAYRKEVQAWKMKEGGSITTPTANPTFQNKEITLLSFGGGQDSTAIFYKIIYDPEFKKKYVKGELVVVMANTFNEHPETYENVDHIRSLCLQNNIEFYLTGSEYIQNPSYKGGLVYHYEKKNNVGSKVFQKTCTVNLKIVPIYEFLGDWIRSKNMDDPIFSYRIVGNIRKNTKYLIKTENGEELFKLADRKTTSIKHRLLNFQVGDQQIQLELSEVAGKIVRQIRQDIVPIDGTYAFHSKHKYQILEGDEFVPVKYMGSDRWTTKKEDFIFKSEETDKTVELNEKDLDGNVTNIFGRTAIDVYGKKYGKVIRALIGIAKGEEGRLAEDQTDPAMFDYWIAKLYPLIPEGMDRKACQDYIKSVGHKVPIPSACIICPFMNLAELLYIYRFQRDWYDKWVQLERNKIESGALDYEGDIWEVFKSGKKVATFVSDEKIEDWISKQIVGKKFTRDDYTIEKGYMPRTYDISKTITHIEKKIAGNGGVWGDAPHRLLPEMLKKAQQQYGHWTDDQVREYRFSHGHCVQSKM